MLSSWDAQRHRVGFECSALSMTDATETSAAPPGDRAGSRERDRAAIRLWLYGICILVFAMIIVGGATRLTDSGLSITEWLPLLGAIPPLTDADWQVVFEKYKQIPEYTEINKGMSLAEFQFIYWWEWAHRLLGRFIGIAFFVPLAWFWVTGRISSDLKPKLIGIFVLGALQGAIGWWMVASGLVDRVDVSQYRLAVHLIIACLIFMACLWVALGLRPGNDGRQSGGVVTFGAGLVLIVILLQIYFGALVAGLDAGLTYNTWPLMDGAIIPGGLFLPPPVWKTLFEDILTVQFMHRMVAYLALILIVWHVWTVLRRWPRSNVAASALVLGLATLAQVGLGIWTLLAVVPLSLGLVHQGGAIVLLAVAVWNLHRAGRIRHT